MYTCNSLIYLWYTLDFRALCNSNIKKRINIDVLHNLQIIIIVQWRRAKHCSSIVHMCSLSLTYYRMACTLINNLKEKKSIRAWIEKTFLSRPQKYFWVLKIFHRKFRSYVNSWQKITWKGLNYIKMLYITWNIKDWSNLTNSQRYL